jgi:two-component system, NarL family, response regulator DevR
MARGGARRSEKHKQKIIRILIVDDHEVVRIGLHALLSLVPGFQIVGEAETALQALALAKSQHPDVVLLDIRLPDRSGVETCRELLAMSSDIRTLFLTSYADDETVLAAVLSGAHGYVLKEIDTPSLVSAIRTVASGHSLLHPKVTKRTIGWLRSLGDPTGRPNTANLSQQERRVLTLLSKGNTNKEIAAALKLSDKTVKNYLANAFAKLQVSRRSQAAALFISRYE